jgi:hypothetical protein
VHDTVRRKQPVGNKSGREEIPEDEWRQMLKKIESWEMTRQQEEDRAGRNG